jgi:hypothetical protein
MTNLHETVAWLTVCLLVYLMASHGHCPGEP